MMMAVLGLQSAVPVIVGVLVAGVVMLAFTLMLVQVTISEVARPAVRATGLAATARRSPPGSAWDRSSPAGSPMAPGSRGPSR